MTIEEKIREIMLSEELSDSEKLDRLRALIPPEVFCKVIVSSKSKLITSGTNA